MKLYCYKKERQRIVNIFEFLQRNNSKVFITPERIEFSNQHGCGSISKELFVDYEVAGSKHLVLPTKVKEWAKNWKELDVRGGRVDLVEISL